MIYGNTTAYRGRPAANFASLSNYLLVDAAAQIGLPSGHAINAVPVTENERIPEIEEVVEAQLFAGRMAELAPGWLALLDPAPIDAMAAWAREPYLFSLPRANGVSAVFTSRWRPAPVRTIRPLAVALVVFGL